MNQGNQMSMFAAENSYFKPPKRANTQNKNSIDEEDHPLSQAIEDFKLRGKVEGRVDKTFQQYDYVLGRFTEQFSEDEPVKSIETRDIRQYLAYLMDDGLANTSVAIHYRVLRAFFNWLLGEGYIARSPVTI